MLKLFVALQTRVMNLRDEKGQAYAEYGILLALVAVGLIVALVAFRKDLATAFDDIGNKVVNP
jgi:pilus assembly protein Flp/PilA